jgi:mannose-1-phosphate guanylyltransferase
MAANGKAGHRHAVVLAGGSGTRLWPLSRGDEPKQLVPIQDGRSLLELALERLDGVVGTRARYVCAGERHRTAVARLLPGLEARRYLGEPEARDTLAAVTLSAAVIAAEDPEAVVGIFTADHVIRPVEGFRRIVAAGFDLVAANPRTVLTFGISPTHPATGYGYLELAEDMGECARRVSFFREKPDPATAMAFVAAGAERYLWNSGMFVFSAATLLERIRQYAPPLAAAMSEVAAKWDTPRRGEVLAAAYAGLPRVSFDYGFMERAAADPALQVAALPMPLEWVDVGSWPSLASLYTADAAGNAAPGVLAVLEGCTGTLLVSTDPAHLVAALGCDDLVIVHTDRATLVCRKDRAEDVKKLQALVAERFGPGFV